MPLLAALLAPVASPYAFSYQSSLCSLGADARLDGCPVHGALGWATHRRVDRQAIGPRFGDVDRISRWYQTWLEVVHVYFVMDALKQTHVICDPHRLGSVAPACGAKDCACTAPARDAERAAHLACSSHGGRPKVKSAAFPACPPCEHRVAMMVVIAGGCR
jgi:hypothetical protein